MLIQSFNKVLAATATWASTTRTLTSMGPTAMVDYSNANLSVVALGTLSLSPGANRYQQLQMFYRAGAAGSLTLTSSPAGSIVVTVCASGQTATQSLTLGGQTQGTITNNDAVNAATVAIAGFFWQQQ